MATTVEPDSSAGDIPLAEAIAALERMGRVALSPGSKIDVTTQQLLLPDDGGFPEGSQAERFSAAHVRYRALIEKIPAVTFMAALDESVHELYISPQIENLLGFSQAQWLADPFLWYRQLHPDDRAEWGAAFARTCSTGVNFKSEYRLHARDGHIVWIHGECQLITDHKGRPILLMGIAFDITERKLAEQRLQESNRALELAVRAERNALAGLRGAQAELTELNRSLEDRVAQRTSELEAAHAKLIQVARQAGMAEVASGVLHNVGNFLNTVNVRTSLVQDKIKRSRISGFDRVCQVLDEHSGNLGAFLASDERGVFCLITSASSPVTS